MKYNLALSFGGFIILAADTVENVLSRFAFTPGGGSNVNIRPALSRFTGRRGIISQVKNSLNVACGCIEWSFFSSVTSQDGAR
jgi:hypothetical protein